MNFLKYSIYHGLRLHALSWFVEVLTDSIWSFEVFQGLILYYCCTEKLYKIANFIAINLLYDRLRWSNVIGYSIC